MKQRADCTRFRVSELLTPAVGMEKPDLQRLNDIFFSCDKAELLRIFEELLSAMEAEEILPPAKTMSQNYETAQANPEINTLPGNLKDARDAIFPFFWGTDGWYSKLHLENVKGPANYASLVGAVACLLKNPNLCVDTYSQRSNELEVKAITSLANLLFYHIESPWGVFTAGGTISNMYGGKIGIEKVCPQTLRKGLAGERLVGIVSTAAHYSNQTLASWLGLGTENLHAIPTDQNCSMRLDLLAERLDEIYGSGAKPAFIIATFGSTDAFGIDDVEGIRRIAHERAGKYGAPPPQIHVDAAVGWTLCFLMEYDTGNNPYGFAPEVLPLIDRSRDYCRTLRFADSVTIDFHKMGWGHYPASAFVVNHRNDLVHLFRSKEDIPYFAEAEYRRDPALFTLECSRPAIGPYSVMASLNGIGLAGYQILVAHALEMAHYLKQRLEALDYCKVLNLDTVGSNVVWWVLPKGRNAAEILRRVEAGRLAEKDYQRYFKEVRHLFEKRKHMMDPQKDACLSFTTAMGYTPHGLSLPAWKAVFFNPKTDRAVVDQLIQSIEEL
jgi:glutamate/tyrosine decarboxylase-like PLP-dependent enzyme